MKEEVKQNIVIIGAGFAGIRCALDLARAKRFLPNNDILLIDRNNFHLFTPRLYQHATTGACRENLKIPIRKILKDLPITFMCDSVDQIDRKNQTINLKSGQEINYEYLILAIGNQVNYFGIPGLNEYGLCLKTHDDAEKIFSAVKNAFAQFIKNHSAGEVFHVIIGGGGFTGVELAGEMHYFLKNLCKKSGKGEGDFIVKIVEGSDRLLPGQPDWVSRTAGERLGFFRRLEVSLQSKITRVTAQKIYLSAGDVINYHVFIWTGGVMVSELLGQCQLKIGKRCRVVVDSYLKAKGNQNIFAIGDCAIYRQPRMGLETNEVILEAYEQGKLAAKNIIRQINDRPLIKYQIRSAGHVIPIRGSWAISTIFIPLRGLLAFWLMKIIHLRYFLMIMPIREAFKLWRNDNYCPN